MTGPEDDLEQALRKALSAAVGGVEPGADGLERIRARTSRPPRRWPLAMASGVVERARNWVWRGHWVWARPSFHQVGERVRHHARHWAGFSSPVPRAMPRSMSRALIQAARSNWVRPAAVLGGVASIAAAALAVPPLRQAIVQASSDVLTGGQTTAVLGTSTDGGGAPAGGGARQPGPGQPSPGASSPAAGHAAAPATTKRGTRCAAATTDTAAGAANTTLAHPEI